MSFMRITTAMRLYSEAAKGGTTTRVRIDLNGEPNFVRRVSPVSPTFPESIQVNDDAKDKASRASAQTMKFIGEPAKRLGSTTTADTVTSGMKNSK